MGFNDLFDKGKKLFEDGKEKVTDFVESEKGEQLIDQSKNLFESGKEKVTELVESDKGQQIIGQSKKVFEDGKEKVTDFFDGDKGDQETVPVSDSAADIAKKISPEQFDANVVDPGDQADRPAAT